MKARAGRTLLLFTLTFGGFSTQAAPPVCEAALSNEDNQFALTATLEDLWRPFRKAWTKYVSDLSDFGIENSKASKTDYERLEAILLKELQLYFWHMGVDTRVQYLPAHWARNYGLSEGYQARTLVVTAVSPRPENKSLVLANKLTQKKGRQILIGGIGLVGGSYSGAAVDATGLLINPLVLVTQMRRGVLDTLAHENEHMLLDERNDPADNIWFIAPEGGALIPSGYASDLSHYDRRYSIQEAQARYIQSKIKAANIFDKFRASWFSATTPRPLDFNRENYAETLDSLAYTRVFAESNLRNLNILRTTHSTTTSPPSPIALQAGFFDQDGLLQAFDHQVPERLASLPAIIAATTAKQTQLLAQTERLQDLLLGLTKLNIDFEDLVDSGERNIFSRLRAIPSPFWRSQAIKWMAENSEAQTLRKDQIESITKVITIIASKLPSEGGKTLISFFNQRPWAGRANHLNLDSQIAALQRFIKICRPRPWIFRSGRCSETDLRAILAGEK